MTTALLTKGLVILLSSFVGTLGFAIVLHVPKRAWLPSSLIGAISYTTYWVLGQTILSEAAANFVGALIGSLLAQYCARKMRMIASVFLMLSIIPLVPGVGLYRCMHFLAQELYSEGAAAGVQAMVFIVMITLGLGVGNFVFHILDVVKRHRKGAALK